VITLERPAEAPELAESLQPATPARRDVSSRATAGLGSRASAVVLLGALLAAIAGSAGVLDAGIALGAQGRAASLHQRWAAMRADGIPDADLAALEQEWTYSQGARLFNVGAGFWQPGASAIVDRWQVATDTIWEHDLRLYRAGAVAADKNLHRVLGTESRVQAKARSDALAAATTPGDFAALLADWALAAKLVPVDRRIASATGSLATQAAQAKNLGIRSDPSADLLARADAYSNMESQQRMARAELLTRGLVSGGKDLQGRIDAATATQQAFKHTAERIYAAGLYGINLSGYQGRIDADHGAYTAAATAAEFNRISGDLNQISSSADSAIYAALNSTHIISGVSFIYQNHPLSCEEAATSMAMTHQGIYVSQDQILAELGADRRPMYVDGAGRVRWGNPYETFVGNVNGSESNYTGFGTFYPPLVRIAKAHGATILAYGSMSADTIYARVIAGHPVVAFATWDWGWHPRRDYLSFDGQWIPWIGPYHASHVYTVVGISPGSVLINDPIRGQYWISKGAFQAGYSDFNEAIVFA
jgi:uncharacterized protein YvpB